MQFSGIHTLTLLDYPDKVSAIVFTPGCNMRCRFCHNAEFVLPHELKKIEHDGIPEEKVLHFLETRKGLLDGVVISGGEPTIHADLLEFMKKVKALGFLVKLDSNGTNPHVLKKIFEEKLVDYVAMDIKASPALYDQITGVQNDFPKIEESKNLIMNSGVDYEFRTTVIRGFHDEEDVEKIAQFCQGARLYTLQNYRNGKVLDVSWERFTGFSRDELNVFKNIAEKYIEKVKVLE